MSRSGKVALLALVLAGLGIRTQLIAIGPLLPQMTRELDLSYAVAGLLTTIPLLMMALVAIPSAVLGHRFGPRRVVGLSLGLLALTGTARALAPDAATVLAMTVGVGVAIGVVGVILPVFVKEQLPHQPARATGLYVTAMLVGSSLAGTLSVPIAELGGGWRDPLLVFGLLSLASVAGWLLFTDPDRGTSSERPLRGGLPWRRPVAWLLVAAFCLQALLFFGLVTWLAPTLVESGWSEAGAGVVVGVLLIAGLPGTLLVSWLADRISRRTSFGLAAAVTAAAVGAFAVLPGAAVVWAVLCGVSLGAIFAIVMTLPLDAAGHPAEAGQLAALMLAGGYLLSAGSPAFLGLVRDMTDSFSVSMWLLVGTAVALLISALVLTPGRLRPTAQAAPITSRAARAAGE